MAHFNRFILVYETPQDLAMAVCSQFTRIPRKNSCFTLSWCYTGIVVHQSHAYAQKLSLIV